MPRLSAADRLAAYALDEHFVAAWQEASSLADFAAQTGIAGARASQRAAALRRAGVPLKRFKKGTQIDVERLSAIARRHSD
ncbi:MAG: hypothetical protein Q8S13_09260 [Dehalococcoidia bacterium]|nr:hypothetical protein [Dehalococcoidia bacterium]